MAITFDITASGPTASQANAAATTAIKITGNLAGGYVNIFASNEDANFGAIQLTKEFKHNHGAQVFSANFPAGTFFYVTLEGAESTPACKVVMW